jgi:heterodisulfide reductase subunit C
MTETVNILQNVIWDVALCRACMNRCVRGTYHLYRHLLTLVPLTQIFLP